MSYVERETMLNILDEYEVPGEGLDEHARFLLMEDLMAIPSADVVPAQRWIPVTERMPEVEQDTLCHFDDGFIATATYNPNLRDWEVWADAGEVTHWMPLPEPPREEEEK